MIRKIIYSLPLLIFVSNSVVFSQSWFPLEIGNRWDYFVEIQIPGGITSYDTLSLSIIEHPLMPNGLEYFEFSEVLPYQYPTSKFIREEGNMFYCFVEEDSTDCFAFRFDLPPDSFYINCRGNTKYVDWVDTFSTFGIQDIHQNQGTFYEFSFNFGAYNIIIPSVADYFYTLEGCIISGVTYGNLLVRVENENQLPIDFNLFQNYPNPFNPSTTIKFTISSLQFTTLKIYDILGNEIATLVNEGKPSGEYEVEFNGTGLPGGIYFYQLRAGNYIETKKMVLLK